MPTKRFPLEQNGPERLQIAWGNVRWSKCVVSLDGATIDTFSIADLDRGHTTRLPNGEFLTLQRASLTNVQAVVNGQPLPGSAQARSQIVLGYAVMFAAFSVLSLLIGVIGGVAILTSNPGQSSALIGGVGLLVGGVVVAALCALTARGLWRLESWAIIPAVIVVGLFEVVFLFALVNGYILAIVGMVGVAIPLYQLLTADDFRSPEKKRARKRTDQARAVNAKGEAIGPSLEQFQRQVEAALSPETRARLQIGFSSSPIISAVYSRDGANWGWFECAGYDPASGQCGLWKVNSPAGQKTVVAANETALVGAIGAQ